MRGLREVNTEINWEDIEGSPGQTDSGAMDTPALQSSALVKDRDRLKLWRRTVGFRAARRAHKRKNHHNILPTMLCVAVLLVGVKWYDGGSRGTRYALTSSGGYEEFDFLGYRRLETTTFVENYDYDGRRLEEVRAMKDYLLRAYSPRSPCRVFRLTSISFCPDLLSGGHLQER